MHHFSTFALAAGVMMAPTLVLAQDVEPEETYEETSEAMDIVAVASGAEQFSTLVSAVQAADLVSVLQGEGPFTVFAPSNEAFEAIPADELNMLLMPENQAQLSTLLKNHVVAGSLTAADLRDGQTLQTLGGESLTVSVQDDGTVMVGNAMVNAPDIEASNGVIHGIGSVIIPEPDAIGTN